MRLREILTKSLPPAFELLQRGEPLMEISDAYVPPRGGKRLTGGSTRPRPRSGSGKEDRYITIGLSQRYRLLIVAHTERGERTRIISARPLTSAEREAYEEEINR
jgi:hypothetical protein